MERRFKVALSTGGTGGHILPAMQLAHQLKERGVEVSLFGSGLRSKKYVQNAHIPFKEICSGHFNSPSFFSKAKGLFFVFLGLFQSLFYAARFRPDIVISFGGYGAFPMTKIASLLGAKVVVFEPNSLAGVVNAHFSKRAKISVFCSPNRPRFLHGSAIKVRAPIWKEEMKKTVSKASARQSFGLDPDKETLLVFGGSQGAVHLNSLLAKAIAKSGKWQVIHATGKEDPSIKQIYEKAGMRAFVTEFIDPMALAWIASDCVICRAGAMTLSEMRYFGVAGALIPYPFAKDGHQKENVEGVEGVTLIEESALSEEKILSFLSNKNRGVPENSSSMEFIDLIMQELK